MDKIPYEDYDHPYWEDPDEEDKIRALLEPSDFYFEICEEGCFGESDLVFVTIIPKRFFDENGYWCDMEMGVGHLFNHLLPFRIVADEETTYSPLDASVTKEQMIAALKAAGFIHNPDIMYDVSW